MSCNKCLASSIWKLWSTTKAINSIKLELYCNFIIFCFFSLKHLKDRKMPNDSKLNAKCKQLKIAKFYFSLLCDKIVDKVN